MAAKNVLQFNTTSKQIVAEEAIWVFADQQEGIINPSVLDITNEAYRLAKESCAKVCVALIGHGISVDTINEIFACGADIVCYADNICLERHDDEAYTDILEQMVKEYMPSVFLFSSAQNAKSLAAKLASRLNTGLTADCINLKFNKNGKLEQTRVAQSGDCFATIVCPEKMPQMATVKLAALGKAKYNYKRSGVIINFEAEVQLSLRKKIISISKLHNSIPCKDSDIVVSFGRGISNKDSVIQIFKLANLLKGMVGATRGAVEAGFIDPEYQIGQTGLNVNAKLYIAFGISGSMQHMVGIPPSCFVIAVNKDARAPIFEFADIGILGDANEVLNVMVQEFQTCSHGNCPSCIMQEQEGSGI